MLTTLASLLLGVSLSTTPAKAAYLPAHQYVLEDYYAGPDFFNGWTFFNASDPTNGFVQYVNESTALRNGLIDSEHGPVYIGVDYTSTLNATTGPGRQSVRISTEKTYDTGSLIILDSLHMPGGICGTWPAFWSFSQTIDWPNGGEIDIVEQVNTAMNNQMTLHTGPNCSITGTFETGNLLTTDCAVVDGNGCSVVDPRNNSFGVQFNEDQGGVFATQWTSDFIRIWFFPRNQIPWDIQSRQPNPANWGEPAANFQGDCNIPQHFVAHQLVFDTTFCGDWAGAVWDNYPTCVALAPTCTDYVASNPRAFRDAYWLVNYVAVYQPQTIPGSSTLSSSLPTSYTTHPWGFQNPTNIPVAAGQQNGWGPFHVSAPPSATTTAVITQAPATGWGW